MKVGFASLVGLEPRPLETVVGWAATNGLHGMEVNIGPGYPVTDGQKLRGHLDLERILSEGPEPVLEPLRQSRDRAHRARADDQFADLG